jgi:AcrR family transcriptional regulator
MAERSVRQSVTSRPRERIIEAMVTLVLERGYEGASLETVLELAAVDLAGFQRHFVDKEDCCMQIYVENRDVFDTLVFGAAQRRADWRQRLRAAAYAAARYVRDHPRQVAFDEIQFLEGAEYARADRDRYVQRIIDLIDEGRQELDDPNSLTRAVAETSVGSIYSLMVMELHAARGTRSAEDFVPQLMYIAVRPYLGHTIASEELSIPPPPEDSAGERGA